MIHKRASISRQPAVWLIAAGSVIFLLSLFLLLAGQNEAGEAQRDLPDQIAGLQLSQRTQGQAAIEQINQMHGLGFPLLAGAIGMYGPGQEATLWVAGVEDSAAAAQMVDEMRDKISLGRSPFLPTGQWQDGNRVVYALEGLDQQHIYFQAGSQVVWLAVDATFAEQAVDEVLRYYRR